MKTPATPVKPLPTGLVLRCTGAGQRPAPALIDKHSCMREEYWASFAATPVPDNSHPIITLEIRSLTPLPYKEKTTYVMSPEPQK